MSMKKRHLITSPLEWMMSAMPVPPAIIPVIPERGGTQLRTPKPVLLIDSREQDPIDFSGVSKWFTDIKRVALELGDYSIEGFEQICVVERKSLSDLVRSFTEGRAIFVSRLRRLAK